MRAPVSAAPVLARAGAGARPDTVRARRLAAVSGWLALSLWAAMAQPVAAHSFPTPFRILFDADNAEHMAVLLRPGIAFTDSGGESFRFLCGALTGSAGAETYPAVLAGGHLLVGSFVGLYRDDGHGCDWSRVDDSLPGGRILSLAQVDERAVEALIAATKDQPAARYVSHDQGTTWTHLTAALPTTDPRTLVRVPGVARALYLIGRHPSAPDLAIWASEDDGESWLERSRLDANCDEILAVEPGTVGRIYLRCRAETTNENAAAVSDLPDRVLLSEDAARSFVPWLELPQIGGFALTPHRLGVWVGSRSGGLWLADASGKLLSLDASLHVGCLQYWDGTLWVCARDESGYDDYAIAISRDGGHTLTPFLHSAEVSALQTCGNPLQARVCSSEWNQWLADVALMQADTSGPSATPSATQDASGAVVTIASASAGTGDMPSAAGGGAVVAPESTAAQPISNCSVSEVRGLRGPISWAFPCSFACALLLRMAAHRNRRNVRSRHSFEAQTRVDRDRGEYRTVCVVFSGSSSLTSHTQRRHRVPVRIARLLLFDP